MYLCESWLSDSIGIHVKDSILNSDARQLRMVGCVKRLWCYVWDMDQIFLKNQKRVQACKACVHIKTDISFWSDLFFNVFCSTIYKNLIVELHIAMQYNWLFESGGQWQWAGPHWTLEATWGVMVWWWHWQWGNPMMLSLDWAGNWWWSTFIGAGEISDYGLIVEGGELKYWS